MSKVLLTCVCFLFVFWAKAQLVCELAYEIEEPQNYCGDFSFDGAVASEPATSCNPTNDAENLWFKFVADGENVVIHATHENGLDVFFSIIQFTTLDCDPSKFVEITCGQNSLIQGGLLVEGVEYYVMFEVEGNQGGDAELCIHSQHDTPPPANDKPCDATVVELGGCILGTTQYAEVDQDSFPCGDQYTQDVWYTFQLTNELAFGAKVDIIPNVDTAEFQVSLVEFTFDTCNTNYLSRRIACTADSSFSLQSNNLDVGTIYHIIVASPPGGATDFELCVEQFLAVQHTIMCFPEIITINGECQEINLFNSLYTSDMPDCDYTNRLQYYQFDSGDELESVDIRLDSLGEESNVFLGFGYHEGNTCLNDFIWQEQFCGDVSDAQMLIEGLMPNTEYTIVVGNNFGFADRFELCVNGNYPNPFYNGSECTAYELTPDQNCIGGTTAVGGVAEGLMSCDDAATQTENWYKIKHRDFSNPTLQFNNFSTDANYEFIIGHFPQGCTNSLVGIDTFCMVGEGFTYEIDVDDSIEYVYLTAIFPNDTTYNFTVCINYEDPPVTCENNDFCQEAINIGEISSDQETCFEACSYNATRENTAIPILNQYPSVWYSFEVSEESTVKLTFGEAYDAKYYVSLVSSTDCNTYIVHDIKYAFVSDESFMRFNVPGSGSFFFVVSSVEERGGYVELCAIKENENTCAIDDQLRVSSASMGSPFSGPFQPGEVVSFCYDLPAYRSGELSDCQWLQGIVPSFGSGWDVASFAEDGMPVLTSPINSIDDEVHWDWFADINANVANNNIFLSYNQQAELDLCHSTENDCQGSPLAVDDLLPPGWFAYKVENEHPEQSYGDGLSCGQTHGPWQVCFQLIAGEGDHSVTLFSFADGLIANDAIMNEFCLNDIPETQVYFVECQETAVDTAIVFTSCSDTPILGLEDVGGRYFWTTSPNSDVQGNASGTGAEFVIDLENLSDTIQLVHYDLQEYSATGCLTRSIDLTVRLFPELDIPRPVTTTVCQQESVQMSEIIDLDDYVLGDYFVDWGSDNVENDKDAFWMDSSSEEIYYSVVNEAGCTFVDTFLIEIEDVIVSEFLDINTVCANAILDFHTALPLTEIIATPFTVDWMYDGLEDSPFVDTSFTESTKIPFEITGEKGCTFADTFTVEVPFVDISVFDNTKLCSDDAILLNAEFSVDSVAEVFWVTPKEDTLFFNNIAVAAEQFADGANVFDFQLTSVENCVFTATDTLEIFRIPEINFNQQEDTIGICSYQEVSFVAEVTPSIYALNWFTPLGEFDALEFETATEGAYNYSAGHVDGDISCRTSGVFYVDVYPDVETGFLYDTLICVNDTTDIFSTNPNLQFVWSTGSNSSVILATPGDYAVTVTNTFGCSDNFDFSVNGRALPSPSFTFDEQLCEGDSTEIIASDPQYSYLWESGSTESTELSFGGTHKVIVTDDIMCQDSFDFFVNVLEYPDVLLEYSINEDTLFLNNLTTGEYPCSYVLDDEVIAMAQDTFLVLEPGDYTLSLSCSNNDCTASESVEFSIVVDGLNAQILNPVKIFPNPSSGEFTISYEGEFLQKVEIYSIDGKLMESFTVNQNNETQISTAVVSGTYFMKLVLSGQVITRKILIL